MRKHQKSTRLGQLSIKQVLRNKYYGSCRTRVADKKGMCLNGTYPFAFVFVMDLCVFQCRKSRIVYPVSGAERDSCMISCADPNMAYKVNKSYFQLFSDNTRCANSHKRLFLLMCYVRLSFPPTLSIRAQGKRWTGYPPTDWTALRHKASRQCRISFPKSAAQEPEQ